MKQKFVFITLISIAVYTLFAAYNWNINPGLWSSECRFMWTTTTAMTILFAFMADAIN